MFQKFLLHKSHGKLITNYFQLIWPCLPTIFYVFLCTSKMDIKKNANNTCKVSIYLTCRNDTQKYQKVYHKFNKISAHVTLEKKSPLLVRLSSVRGPQISLERMRYIMDWNWGTHCALIYEIIVTQQHNL